MPELVLLGVVGLTFTVSLVHLAAKTIFEFRIQYWHRDVWKILRHPYESGFGDQIAHQLEVADWIQQRRYTELNDPLLVKLGDYFRRSRRILLPLTVLMFVCAFALALLRAAK